MFGNVLGGCVVYRPVLDLVPVLALVVLAVIHEPWFVETWRNHDQNML